MDTDYFRIRPWQAVHQGDRQVLIDKLYQPEEEMGKSKNTCKVKSAVLAVGD